VISAADFRVADHGRVLLLEALSDQGKAWCDRHLPGDALRFAGCYVVDPSYIGGIVEAIKADGLSVS
jgi:hypothetical protein